MAVAILDFLTKILHTLGTIFFFHLYKLPSIDRKVRTTFPPNVWFPPDCVFSAVGGNAWLQRIFHSCQRTDKDTPRPSNPGPLSRMVSKDSDELSTIPISIKLNCREWTRSILHASHTLPWLNQIYHRNVTRSKWSVNTVPRKASLWLSDASLDCFN